MCWVITKLMCINIFVESSQCHHGHTRSICECWGVGVCIKKGAISMGKVKPLEFLRNWACIKECACIVLCLACSHTANYFNWLDKYWIQLSIKLVAYLWVAITVWSKPTGIWFCSVLIMFHSGIAQFHGMYVKCQSTSWKITHYRSKVYLKCWCYVSSLSYILAALENVELWPWSRERNVQVFEIELQQTL